MSVNPADLHQPSGLEIRLTMAPALYGSNLAWMFLGFIFVQTYTYHKHSRFDRLLFKAFIYSAVLIEIAATGLECYVGYRYLVGGWEESIQMAVEVPPKAFLFQPLFDAILGTMVQCFFAWRIWTFGVITGQRLRLVSKFIAVFIVIVSVMALACSMAFPVLFFRVDSQPELWATTRPVVTVWTVSSAVIDIIISTSMIVILRHARSKSYFTETRDTITRLIRLTIQTGALTSLLALSIIVVFLKEPFGNMHTFPAYLLGKSYAMSLLANVNARSRKPAHSRDPTLISPQASLAFSPPPNKRYKKNLPGNSSFSQSTSGITSDMAIGSLGDFKNADKLGSLSSQTSKQYLPEIEMQGEVFQLENVERDTVRCISDLVV